MADILFKKGSYGDFKANILDKSNQVTPGALYLTEDEGGLYIGISQSKVKRIQGSVIFYENALNFKESVIDNPPYSRDVIYFIVQDNALIRWNDSTNKWIQINATADSVTNELNALSERINDEILRATAEEGRLAGLIADNTTLANTKLDASTYNTFKAGYDTKVGELEQGIATNAQGVTDAKNAAKAAQDTANQAVIDAAAALADSQTRAIKKHDSTTTEYGGGTGSNYGHVKLSDAVDSTSAASASIAATPKAVKAAYDAAADAMEKAEEGVQAAANAQETANQGVIDAGAAMTKAQQGVDDAENARKLAQKALDEKVDKTTYATDKASLEGLIADAKQAGTNAQNSVNTLSEYVGTIPSSSSATSVIAYINAESSALNKKIEDETSRAQGVEQNLLTAIGNVSTVANQGVADAKRAHDAADAAQLTANNAAELANEKLPMDGSGEMTGDLKMGGKAIVNLADLNPTTADGKMAANKNYVDYAVAKGIAENDAMTYKGVLTTKAGLDAITSANTGDTYKIGAEFGGYKIGDLLINSGADGMAPTWDHISSGYESEYTQKLYHDESTATIFLTDGVNESIDDNNVGGFRIEAKNTTNLKFSVETDSDNIHVITATMEWGSFTTS